ncbi:MAG: hypothetical protein L6R43_08440 [Planctomycetes bacterium]|nr:hypothetical protein [Planctomycetota bacterium]
MTDESGAPPPWPPAAMRESAVPARFLVHLAAGGALGAGVGFAVGAAFPSILVGAVHAGFHGGWLAGLLSWLLTTRRAAAAAGGRTLAEDTAIGGVLVGGVGFILGFYGPPFWSPGANQGPLLGIFVTGPLGFVAGAAGGWMLHRLRKGSRAEPTGP